MPLRELSCQARCDAQFVHDGSLNQLVWDAEELGWLIRIDPNGWVEKVRCPAHNGDWLPGQMWVVECSECDYYEEFDTEDEALDDAADHGDDCDCGCWHNAKVLSPEKQVERRKRREAMQQEARRQRQEREYHERYVAFLIERDQQQRLQQPKRGWLARLLRK